MLTFKHPELEQQFATLHPDVQAAVHSLEKHSAAAGWPSVVVTEVLRTPAMQEEYYWRRIKEVRRLPENFARAEARKKFSWHLCGCAVDLRLTQYTPAQRVAVLAFLKGGRDAPMWEILEHDVGMGNHFHVGRRDFAFRTKFKPPT